MKICEIFKSIQGEGQQQGEITTFIRTIGCNLRCKWCDTKYAYEKGKEMTIQEIIQEVKLLNSKNICLTGGEPLIQPDIKELIDQLIELGYQVYIETNGTIDINNFNQSAHYVVDYKLPASGMQNKFCVKNLNANGLYEIKFVISDLIDYDIAKEFAIKYSGKAKILFSPCWDTIGKAKLAEIITKDNLPVRYSLQIHKVIWGVNKKGV